MPRICLRGEILVNTAGQQTTVVDRITTFVAARPALTLVEPPTRSLHPTKGRLVGFLICADLPTDVLALRDDLTDAWSGTLASAIRARSWVRRVSNWDADPARPRTGMPDSVLAEDVK